MRCVGPVRLIDRGHRKGCFSRYESTTGADIGILSVTLQTLLEGGERVALRLKFTHWPGWGSLSRGEPDKSTPRIETNGERK